MTTPSATLPTNRPTNKSVTSPVRVIASSAPGRRGRHVTTYYSQFPSIHCMRFFKKKFILTTISIMTTDEFKCQGGGDRRRRRSIIRKAMDNGACPVLEEIQPCSSQDANCWNHQWRVSEWSSCLPLGGSNCGEGIRTRIVSCFRTDGYSVNSRCASVTSFHPPLLLIL